MVRSRYGPAVGPSADWQNVLGVDVGTDVREVLRRGWWLLVIGLLTGLAVALSAGLALGSTGADLVVTGFAGLLAGNTGGVVAAVLGMRIPPARRAETPTAA